MTNNANNNAHGEARTARVGFNAQGAQDTFTWQPGDGDAVVAGGPGLDTLVFTTSNVSEIVELIDMGGHVILSSENVLDINGIEQIRFEGSGGGEDVFFFGDLSGTQVRALHVDLGGPDGLVDSVVVQADARPDHVVVTGSYGEATVLGAKTSMRVVGGKSGDRVVVDTLDGADTVDVSGFKGELSLDIWGGRGADRFVFGTSVGADVKVLDFTSHAFGKHGDVLVLRGFADQDFAQAVASHHIVQTGADVVVSDDGGAIVTLQNVLLSDLGAKDFLFS